MTRILLGLIRGYQMSVSKILPPSCRYYPSCSQYTYEAVGDREINTITSSVDHRALRCG